MRALGRSGRLVRGGWLKVGSLTIAAAAITLAAGPIIGTLLILFTDVPLGLLNLIAGVGLCGCDAVRGPDHDVRVLRCARAPPAVATR